MKRIIITLLGLVLLPVVCHSQIIETKKGMCGEHITWILYSDSSLHIIGYGKMDDYKRSRKSPFNKSNIAPHILTINLSGFHGRLGKNAFVNCTNLKRLVLSNAYNIECDSETFGSEKRIIAIDYNNSKYKKDEYRVCLTQLPRSMPDWIKNIVDENNIRIIVDRDTHSSPPLEVFQLFPDISYFSNLSKYTYDNGEYYGQTSSYGVRNGIGKYSWKSGDWYIGEWKDGDRIGKGEYHFPNGNVYIGGIIDGKITGRGMEIINNGSIYVGDFIDGWWDGLGTFYYAKDNNDRIYHGHFKHGLSHGYGIKVQNDGTIMMGLWADGKYMGKPESISFNMFLDFPEVLPLNIIAQQHIKKCVNKWKQKGEFETTEEWKIRVTKETMNKMGTMVYTDIVNQYIQNAASKVKLKLTLGLYDADNRTFLLTDSVFGNMIVAMKGEINPQEFKNNWGKIIAVPTYYYNGSTSSIDIQEILFFLDNKVVAKYCKDTLLDYRIVEIEYDDDEPITIKKIDNTISQIPRIDTVLIEVKSDVDRNIPKTLKSNPNTYVFIIANEEYKKKSRVPFALNDGRVFSQYCTQTLGIDEKHVTMYENATSSNIIECVELMKSASNANSGKINILFYYAGHAFPDEGTGSPYILPVDGDITIPRTCYSLNQLYSEMRELQANSVVCFIDACFSGATREDGTLLTGRGPKRNVPDATPMGNVVVFSASQAAETAHQYHQKSHGMFTYFLLKKLQDTRGRVTLGELSDYVIEKVSKTSFDENRKVQTPKIIPSPKLQSTWQDIRL